MLDLIYILCIFFNILFQENRLIMITYYFTQMVLVVTLIHFMQKVIFLGYKFKQLNEQIEKNEICQDIIKPVSLFFKFFQL